MSEQNQKSTQPQELELRINGLAAGGRGLARGEDGRVVFVAGALAGEKVRAAISAEKRQYLEAETLEVLTPCPQRAEPACPLYGKCGGCDLMHLDYQAQLAAKREWADHALKRLGAPPAQAVASPQEWGYRNRVRLQAGQGGIGFFARSSHDMVRVEHCPVAADGINAFLAALAGREFSPWPQLAWLELISRANQETLALAGLAEPLADEKEMALKDLLLEAGAQGVRLQLDGGMEPWPYDQAGGLVYYEGEDLSLRAYPGVFCQVNWPANALLIDHALEAAGEAWGEARALDLYAGAGNFSLPLAARGWGVLAVEGDAQAVAAGRAQAELEGLAESVVFQRGQAGRALRDLAKDKETCDLALLDPPRAGAKGLMSDLAALKPRKVIYVSCHAAALARDAAKLLEHGYKAERVTVIDMFPHTSHLETVMALTREDP